MSDRKPFVGGNWKMNTDQLAAGELTRALSDGSESIAGVEIVVYPPFPYLLTVGSILKTRASHLSLGAQDVWHEPSGAFTGEISTGMLSDCGATSVLLGHSERRHVVGEPDELIRKKLGATLEAGLRAVLCIGETLEQREAGKTDEINVRQIRSGLDGLSADDLASVVIAYEPVWAIGTGRTASPADAQDAHAKIRSLLAEMFGQETGEKVRIIYGGSMKPGNAADLLAQPDIDGGLIGGASLKSDDFLAIARAAATRAV